MLPQLVKLGKSARWSSHFLFTSAGKQATGKTTHSTYLHHSPASVSSLLLQASPHSHAFLCSVCSFPISLHAFPLLPLTSYLRLFLLIPLCFIPSCTSSLFTLHLHPASLAFNNSSSLSLGVQCMKHKSPQSHRQQALEHCWWKRVLMGFYFRVFKHEEMDCMSYACICCVWSVWIIWPTFILKITWQVN